jgi:NAD+ synthase
MKKELVSWIKECFKGSHSPVIIGISGGKDSTVVAALCVEALGKERIVGVLMPQSHQSDIDVSYKVIEHLGIKSIEINIGEAVESLYGAIPIELNEVVVMNTPARIRMTTLYAIASAMNGRVANTCNASEIFVGWGTKYGDAAGDFSPLSDLTVTEVKELGYELDLPAELIEKIPIDGLCGKSDEEALGFSYDVLDRYIREGVCENEKTLLRIESLHKSSEHKRNPMPSFKKGS